MHPASPEPYVDKVMSASELPAGGGAPPDEEQGDYRSWYFETRLVNTTAAGSALAQGSARELGQRVGYRQETLNYGDYELLADVRASNGLQPVNPGPTTAATQQRSGQLTLRNTAFPLTTRTFADSAVGDTFSEVTDALSRNYRLSLGTRPVRGLSARIHSEDLDVRAGTGIRGDLLGGPFAGFERSTGSLSWVGASRRTPLGTVGLQVDQASGNDTALDGTIGEESVRSAAVAWRFNAQPTPGLGLATRLTAIRSSTQSALAGASGDASGIFAEGSLVSDNARQEFGVFRADPTLRFADARIYDARGAYWRMDGVRTNLGWGLGAQVDDQLAEGSLPGSRQIALQANAQYQVDRRHALGGSINLEQRRYDASALDDANRPDARSLYASAYWQQQPVRSGRTRFLLTVRRNQALVLNGDVATGEEASWEQEWLLDGNAQEQRAPVVTTLGVARDSEDGVSRFTPTAGVRAVYSPAPNWNVSANLHYTSTHSNLSTTQGVSGYADTDYAFDNGWRIGASLTLNQVATRLDAAAVVASSGTQLYRTHDSYFMLWARWEASRGSTPRGLGESRSIGGGALRGTVFFDENRDGEQQPQEQGVAGVEVIVDGHYRTTTDNYGRFVFPLVSTGVHRVEVRPESVPLPWGPRNDNSLRADVPLRGEANVFVPVVKVGD